MARRVVRPGRQVETIHAQDRHFHRCRRGPRRCRYRPGRQPRATLYSAPQSQWLPIQELQAKVEALGYKVQKAKLKNACGELYTIDKNGGRVELFVDPTSGEIVGQL